MFQKNLTSFFSNTKFTGSLKFATVRFGKETDRMMLPTEVLLLPVGYKVLRRIAAIARLSPDELRTAGKVTLPVTTSLSVVFSPLILLAAITRDEMSGVKGLLSWGG